MNRNQLPTILVATSAAGHLIGNVIPTLEHVRDPDWPAHARFHAIQAIGLLTGMDLIAIAIAIGPLRRRERWAFWTELTYVLFAQGGYFASIAVLPKGRPRGAVFHLLYACATAMFLVGLLQSQRIQAVTDLPAGLAHASRRFAASALRDLAPVEEDAADEGGLPGVLEAVADHSHQPDAQRDQRVHPSSTIRDRPASARRTRAARSALRRVAARGEQGCPLVRSQPPGTVFSSGDPGNPVTEGARGTDRYGRSKHHESPLPGIDLSLKAVSNVSSSNVPTTSRVDGNTDLVPGSERSRAGYQNPPGTSPASGCEPWTKTRTGRQPIGGVQVHA